MSWFPEGLHVEHWETASEQVVQMLLMKKV